MLTLIDPFQHWSAAIEGIWGYMEHECFQNVVHFIETGVPNTPVNKV